MLPQGGLMGERIMYRFVDQPLDRQVDGPRFLIWAMRRWVAAAVEGRCACHTLQTAFAGMRMEQAIDDFHVAMRTLCNNARVSLRFGAVDRLDITEHEAVLVATAIAAARGDDTEVTGIARQLVHADMAVVFARSFSGVARAFAQAGLALDASVNGPANR
jgi:hypothetical protein